MKHRCPACAWPHLEEAPRSSSGAGSYEICPSCGFQPGVTDDDEGITAAQWRERWRHAGAKWWSQTRPAPAHWDAAQQLREDGLA